VNSICVQSPLPTVPTTVYSFEVAAGILPTPFSPLSAMQVLADLPAFNGTGYSPPTFVVQPSLQNTQLYWRRSLTFVIRLVNSLLNTTDLRMAIPFNNLTLTALTGTNKVIGGAGNTLNYAQLVSLMYYVPKNALIATCADCALVPAATAPTKGVDAFSLPVYNLLSAFVIGSAFQSVMLNVTFDVGSFVALNSTTVVSTNAGGASRRLYSIGGSSSGVSTTHNRDGTVTVSFVQGVDWTGYTEFNPTYSFWNATSNTTITEPVLVGGLPLWSDVWQQNHNNYEQQEQYNTNIPSNLRFWGTVGGCLAADILLMYVGYNLSRGIYIATRSPEVKKRDDEREAQELYGLQKKQRNKELTSFEEQ
jgi:hypothetical protein